MTDSAVEVDISSITTRLVVIVWVSVIILTRQLIPIIVVWVSKIIFTYMNDAWTLLMRTLNIINI
jgi:hypothetical protein